MNARRTESHSVLAGLPIQPTASNWSSRLNDAPGDAGVATARPAANGELTARFDAPPIGGVLRLDCVGGGYGWVVERVRVRPRFEDLPTGGALDVVCTNAAEFRVEIDGRYARSSAGMVGPLSAGEHVVRLEFQTHWSYFLWLGVSLLALAGSLGFLVASRGSHSPVARSLDDSG